MESSPWLNLVKVAADKNWKMVMQETVEPLMEQYKPPGLIKKIYFKNLSFGDAPFKIENVWVEDEGEKHVLMEVHIVPVLLCVDLILLCDPTLTAWP